MSKEEITLSKEEQVARIKETLGIKRITKKKRKSLNLKKEKPNKTFKINPDFLPDDLKSLVNL